MTVGETARVLWAAGFKPVLVNAGTKRAVLDNWTVLEYTEAELAVFEAPGFSLGIRFGAGVIDVDLEWPMVAAVGDKLLPPTSLMWGRPGLDRSHRVYRTEVAHYKTTKIKTHEMVKCAELRYFHSQSVVPPSVHPESGGAYAWTLGTVHDAIANVGVVDIGEIEVAVKETVFTATMCDLWPGLSGSRHDAMLGLCGMLLKNGRSLERVEQIVATIVEFGKDPDPADRLQIAAGSAARLEGGEDIAGFTLLEQAMGPEFAKWVGKMFHLPTERVEQVGGILLNDKGNGELLCRLYGEDLMYLPFKTQWCGWDGKRWDISGGGMLELTYAKKTVEYMAGLAGTMTTATERAALRQHALKSGNMNEIAAMIRVSRDVLAKNPETLDKDAWLFNVPNGTLDLCTGVLRPHSRDDGITHMGGVEYDEKAECPLWKGFLHTVFAGDQSLIAFAQRMAGYGMTGNTREQCLFFLYGHGKNGKSTFMEVLCSVLGDYSMRTPSETLIKSKQSGGIPNDVARLRGARFVVSKEVEQGVRLAENQVKDLTGGDTITARFLHGEWFDFRPVMKLFMYGNHKPVIHGQDEGIWRRIRLVPFTVQIPHPVEDFAAMLLAAEGPGILRWCVEGCMQWQVSGLQVPQAVEEGTKEYRTEMDLFGEFFNDKYRVGPGKVQMENVYIEYQGWCGMTGERPMTQRQLNQRLVERGFEKVRSNGKWFLSGFMDIATAMAEAETESRDVVAGAVA